MQNRSFAQSLHFHDFEILEFRKHSGCCGSEVAQALIWNKIHGSAKPSGLKMRMKRTMVP
ncbi:MAG TPA: hypothetical protein VKA34_23300 [Balneolales bacterium]|nr:hypothetical protein [Balneolales bacterium]